MSISPRCVNHISSMEHWLATVLSISSTYYLNRRSNKATIVGAKIAFGKAIATSNSGSRVDFHSNPSLPSHFITFKYRSRQALVFGRISEEKEEVVVEGKENGKEKEKDIKPEKAALGQAGGKRKNLGESSNAKHAAVVIIDGDEEDVKPSRKKLKESDVGGSKETAVDLTGF